RASAGRLGATDVDLTEVARAAIADTVALAAERGIELALECGPSVCALSGTVQQPAAGDPTSGAVPDSALHPDQHEPLMATSSDPQSLAVLVRNLVDNAVRYGHRDGRVIVRVERVERSGVRLTVDDDGPGIPDDEHERVFDRFYRRNPGETTGSGLGLAIVRAIADRHHAQIALDRSPLGGLRVSVRFPGGDEAPTAMRAA
ncbi:MAG: sensor histidine kinase, partial [Proteobacteria bacterium]|nr:sensor histidine kinase [Burkholderiales bacterium]